MFHPIGFQPVLGFSYTIVLLSGDFFIFKTDSSLIVLWAVCFEVEKWNSIAARLLSVKFRDETLKSEEMWGNVQYTGAGMETVRVDAP